ncbi:outer membrane beta-barrel protein [Parvibaculum sp.]|jgi:opacity protein-like surface antigen|uniref:outer membrane protein n=1 Tax=Parvibaculum sp. TaxID=2024848 RepID=UPI001B0BD7B3|nr:outer membrane beta-barrel protein [Parvibaculum sp.]MBO6634154.1 outer membrane beta-barrel protein [Parvibaculum sp.]MBO6679531.1 outer membrane beta-barrel protein [Parvibaculum sp.]MBO6686135.1 outer membrane beta-barrel protein [Parvibaculum sp.]MBO6905926.1 outer membrane beta-barrel protein [Parvibaculum sp.]
MTTRTLAAAVLAAGCFAATAAQAEGIEPYIGIGGSYMALSGDSGGFNTLGAFSNVDSDDTTALAFRAVAGIGNLVSLGERLSLRGELEFVMPQTAKYETFSLAPPYYANDDMIGGFVNLWLDIEVPELREGTALFIGGGYGGFRHDFSVTDGVVTGTKSTDAYAYNLGGGIKTPIVQNLEAVLMTRYVDYGKIGANLDGGASGDYNIDQTGVEFGFTIQIMLGGLL